MCEFLAVLDVDRVGAANMRDIRYKTLDWVGCAVAAQGKNCQRGAAAILREQGGAAQSSAVGLAEKTSSQQAAFYNGIISHALEYDDTNKVAITHPGAPVIAAALAAAEAHGVTFRDYALGVAAGYETMMRVGGALNPDHYEHWHTTGTAGTFAAAAAVGKMLGFDAARLEKAFGIATTMASGLIYVFGTEAKLVTVGNAARNGIVAAELAARDFTAPDDAIAGSNGYAQAANGKEDLSFMVPASGDRLMLEDAYYKMYASCGHTHSALDALQALMAENRFTAADVDSVELAVYRKAFELCSAYQTETETKAKFSLPFCAANMLLYGRVTLPEFASDHLSSTEIAEYAKRITVIESETFTRTYPGLRTERARLHLKDGRMLEKQVDLPVGKPPHAFIENKFHSLAEMTVAAGCADAIQTAVLGIGDDDTLENIGSVIRNLEIK